MQFTMLPFTTYMDVESSRSYMDDLYSPDPQRCHSSIISIKNSVIGSNRQKDSVIIQGVVPRLLQLLGDRTIDIEIRIDVTVIIGSLAKGRNQHIDLLLNSGTIQLLLNILQEQEPRLIDPIVSCLYTLCDVENSKSNPRSIVYTAEIFERLLYFAHDPSTSLQRQYYIANILAIACQSPTEQNALCAVGAPKILSHLLTISTYNIRLPVLKCFAQMVHNNCNVANVIQNTPYNDQNNNTTVGNFLAILVSREQPIEIQLEAARCLTYLYRTNNVVHRDSIITYRALPCLVRLCQIGNLEEHRASAADILAFLTEVDSELQQVAAISNQLVTALMNLLTCGNTAGQQAAFRAFASLTANDEDIRKRVINMIGIIEKILWGLSVDNEKMVMASLRCLLSLSRSVQQLRTTFQDHKIWKPLLELLEGSPSTELLTAVSSAFCNLVLEFSPAKTSLLESNAVNLLTRLTTRPEPCLRLNGIWGLMNMTFQTEENVKLQILSALGTDQIFRLLADPDTQILMKTLGLLRNLVSPRTHSDSIMMLHGPQIMQGVVLVLEGPHPPEVKEQALCILGNIADGERARDHIISNEDILKKIIGYMTHPAHCLQEASVFCINNLVRAGPESLQTSNSSVYDRRTQLKEMGVVNILQQILGTSDSILCSRVKSALGHFNDV